MNWQKEKVLNINKHNVKKFSTELWITEALENRSNELLKMKKDLRLKDETIQQREIEISCLRGQVSWLFCNIYIKKIIDWLKFNVWQMKIWFWLDHAFGNGGNGQQ